eukprot:jgi/Mesvir1/21639/Mv04061-RA.1
MSDGWYKDMLACSEVKETTKKLHEPPVLKAPIVKKLDERGEALSKRYEQFKALMEVADEEEDMDEEYEIEEVLACSDKNWTDMTAQFLRLMNQRDSVCITPVEMMESMYLDSVVEASGTPMSLAVTYVHRGQTYLVTYSLADTAPVRFPPVKADIESCTGQPTAPVFSILSASFGNWFSSEDNVDVTDVITRLLGPDKDFYGSAGVTQHIWCIVQYLRAEGVIIEDSKCTRFLRVICGDGRTLIFHPDTKGCILKSGVRQDRLFDNVPCPLPVAYKEGKGFLVKGCFCSFNCAKAYNFREEGAARDLHNHYLFLLTQRLWYSEHKGVPFPGIIAAPSRATLKMFGGYMDIDTFRQASSTHIHMVREPPYPMEVIQQVDCATAISNKRYAVTQADSGKNGGSVAQDERVSKKAAELESRKRARQEGNLALKRAKPMINKGCSLDKFVNVAKKK